MGDFRLADDLFLAGHNGYSGKAAVNDDVLDVALAGAAIAELIIDRRLDVMDGKVTVLDRRPYGERVSDAVVAEVMRKQEAFVPRAWVEHLCGEVREVLAQRLLAYGVIRRDEARSGLSRRVHVRYPSTDPVATARPLVRAAYLLARPELMDVHSAALCGLIKAGGLDHLLVIDGPRYEIRDLIAATVDRLPYQLRALIAGVESAVAARAVTIRR